MPDHNDAAYSLTRQPGTLRPLARLVWPVLVEQILYMLVGFSDTLLAGWHFQQPHLAAINVLVYLLWMLQNLFAVVSIGATALVARAIGADRRDEASRAVGQAFLLGVALATLAAAVGWACAPAAVSAMQLQGESAALATRYLRTVLPVLPALMASVVGMACLRGAGDTGSSMRTMAVINAVNAALSWSLALGWFGAPKLGWDALGVGNAAGYLAGGLYVAWQLGRGRAGLRLSAGLLRPHRAMLTRLLRIGLPGGLDAMVIVLCQLWFVSIINQLGDVAAAAHGVAIRIEAFGYLPGYAFQIAAATLAGQHLGAGQPRAAARSVWTACAAGGAIMVAAGACLWLFADPLTSWFLSPDQAQIQGQAAPLLRIVSFGMAPLALNIILTGALRGAGDTRWPLVFTLVGYLGVRIPLTYAWAYFGDYGVPGAWYAMLADLTVRCVLVTWRFTHGGWQRVRV